MGTPLAPSPPRTHQCNHLNSHKTPKKPKASTNSKLPTTARSKTKREWVTGLAKDASTITTLSEMCAICAISAISKAIRCSTISSSKDLLVFKTFKPNNPSIKEDTTNSSAPEDNLQTTISIQQLVTKWRDVRLLNISH